MRYRRTYILKKYKDKSRNLFQEFLLLIFQIQQFKTSFIDITGITQVLQVFHIKVVTMRGILANST